MAAKEKKEKRYTGFSSESTASTVLLQSQNVLCVSLLACLLACLLVNVTDEETLCDAYLKSICISLSTVLDISDCTMIFAGISLREWCHLHSLNIYRIFNQLGACSIDAIVE